MVRPPARDSPFHTGLNGRGWALGHEGRRDGEGGDWKRRGNKEEGGCRGREGGKRKILKMAWRAVIR